MEKNTQEPGETTASGLREEHRGAGGSRGRGSELDTLQENLSKAPLKYTETHHTSAVVCCVLSYLLLKLIAPSGIN